MPQSGSIGARARAALLASTLPFAMACGSPSRTAPPGHHGRPVASTVPTPAADAQRPMATVSLHPMDRTCSSSLRLVVEAPRPSNLDTEAELPADLRRSLVELRALRDDRAAAELELAGLRGVCEASDPPVLECTPAKIAARARAARRADAKVDALERREATLLLAANAQFERALGDPRTATAHVALALASLRRGEPGTARRTSTVSYGHPIDANRRSAPGVADALERAVALSAPSDRLGGYARVLLAQARWDEWRLEEARDLLQAATSANLPELRVDIQLRLGLLFGAGPDADHAKAASWLRTAAAAIGANGPRKTEVLQTLMLAEYRAGRFPGVLSAYVAMRNLEVANKSEDQRRRAVRPRDGFDRLAADAIERMSTGGNRRGLEQMLDVESPQTLGELLSHQALRALYRRDYALAERFATSARGWGGRFRSVETDVLDVLAAVAAHAGDTKRSTALLAERNAGSQGATRAEAAIPADPELMTVEDEERAFALRTDGEPHEGERRARALVRLCLEPELWRIPGPVHVEDPVPVPREVQLDVTVHSDGRATAILQGPVEAPLQPFARCLESEAPMVFAGSQEGARIRIAFDRAKTRPPPSATRSAQRWTESRDEPFGAGGLGLTGIGRGGGGLGGGVGLGSGAPPAASSGSAPPRDPGPPKR